MSSRIPPVTRARPEAEPTSFDAAGRPVLRCAIYTRQSVARGEQDLTSCDVQRERCEDYVRAMQYEGWVALDERFDDLGVSGGNLERPALRRLLSWCVQGRVDVVVVTSLDRLARKMSDWMRLNDWLKQVGVELVILQGAGGARGPLAELVYNVTASLAELRAASRSRPSDSHLRCSRPVFSPCSEAVVERDIISERLREAKGRARARGRRAAGRVPLGYRADPNTRQLVVDEDEAALVRAFFERCAAGESGAAIAAWANAAGHRTKVHGGKGGAKWTGARCCRWSATQSTSAVALTERARSRACTRRSSTRTSPGAPSRRSTLGARASRRLARRRHSGTRTLGCCGAFCAARAAGA